MNKINDGGSAFPIPNDPNPGAYPAEPGMSLRDWFAGQALAGYFAATPLHCFCESGLKVVARYSYDMADAMLAARARQKDAE